MSHSDLSIDLIECAVDQINNQDLIGTIMELPSWYPIKYLEGGIYDRVLNNYKVNAKNINLPDQDEYDWFRIPNPKRGNKTICLQRPNKQVSRKRKIWLDQRGNLQERFIWTNIVQLTCYFYRSSIDNKIIAYTFGDKKGNRIIHPFKILKHSWREENKYLLPNRKYLCGENLVWICTECGLRGNSRGESPNSIMPIDPLTCDEMMIKDIIE